MCFWVTEPLVRLRVPSRDAGLLGGVGMAMRTSVASYSDADSIFRGGSADICEGWHNHFVAEFDRECSVRSTLEYPSLLLSVTLAPFTLYLTLAFFRRWRRLLLMAVFYAAFTPGLLGFFLSALGHPDDLCEPY